MSDFIEAGIISALHSFRGEVKIKSWLNSPDFLSKFKNIYLKGNLNNNLDELNEDLLKVLKVKKARVFGVFVIMQFEEIQNEDEALKLKNKTVFINKKEAENWLKEGEYFIEDLKGLSVFDNISGEKYGEIIDVFNNGASDIYIIKTNIIEYKKNGEHKFKEVLLPNVREFVKKISLNSVDDMNAGIFIEPIGGMFND